MREYKVWGTEIVRVYTYVEAETAHEAECLVAETPDDFEWHTGHHDGIEADSIYVEDMRPDEGEDR